ncbi:MAG: hypothetical protein U0792_11885 [Gemmataceae bacterium]
MSRTDATPMFAANRPNRTFLMEPLMKLCLAIALLAIVGCGTSVPTTDATPPEPKTDVKKGADGTVESKSSVVVPK